MQFVHLLLAAGIFCGCDLFSTRAPEDPDTGRGSWEIPRVPQDVLSNLSNAMFERNAVNYLRSFDPDSFRFEADAVALSRDPSLEGWDYEMESNHIGRLLSEGTLPSDSAVFAVFSGIQETILGDSAEIVAQYSLTAQIALTGAPGNMAGSATFNFRIGDEGYWLIREWRDQRTEGAEHVERLEVTRAINIIALIGMQMVYGCANPFAPTLRGEAQSIFTDASTVGGMLENFVTTYELKDSLRYAELLAEDFQFQFYDPNTQRIDGWYRETDLSTTARMFRAYQNVSLIWGGLNSEIEAISTPDSLVDIRVQYQLRLDDIAPLHGFARFTLLKPAGERFRILLWQDEF